ncbi:MAG TPA: alpha-amylase family glycosyl hydrolase [Polyangiaceae bacterium]|jgi:glycosidase
MRIVLRLGLLASSVVCACGASTGGGVHGPTFDASLDGSFDAAVPADASLDASFDASLDASFDAAVPSDAWQHGVLYLTIPDRFANGDPTNDNLGQPGCLDATNANLFHGGDIAGLRQHVGYLKELGVGAVWATPLYVQVPLRSGACGYHGYWADEVDPDDGAMEPKLGTLADVAGLTSDLHASGMRFILDMVVNHSGRGARIVTEDPTWFHDAGTCAQLGDPNVYCPLNGLPDYAQENPVVATYLTNLSRGWVTRVQPDGIRMDTAKNVLTSYFAQSFVPGVRGLAPNLFLIAEYYDTGSIADFVPTLQAGFDSAFQYPLYQALDDSLAKGGSLDEVATAMASAMTTLGPAQASRMVTMLDNHDVDRFLSDAPAGTSAGDLVKRYTLGLVALFTLPGIPQLYQGDELGALGLLAGNANRTDMPAWAFSAATRAGTHAGYAGDGQATWALVQSLIQLRAADAALWQGSYDERWRPNGGANVFAFTRTAPTGTSRDLVVLSNDAAAQTLTLPLGKATPWPDGTVLTDALGAGAPATVTVATDSVTLSLPPLTAAVYRASL